MRKTIFTNNEYYHVYNRGVDKRHIFQNQADLGRFILSMELFNTPNPIGSIYEFQYVGRKESVFGDLVPKSQQPIVEIVAFALIENHFHFILKQLVDGGISKFMQKIGGGYTSYFNEKYKRSGALFQGTYKSKHITSTEYLLHVSVYINLNDEVHQLGALSPKMTSWDEYMGKSVIEICKKDVILEQFDSRAHYERYARDVLPDILKRKKEEKELQKLFLE